MKNLRIRPNIALDCDGVLADFDAAVLRFLFEETGVRYLSSQITTWDILECFGLNSLSEKLDEWIEENDVCSNLSVYPEIKGVLQILRSLGDVHCVTTPHRSPSWPSRRVKWLSDHLGFSYKEIHLTAAKHLFDVDVLVDDGLHNALPFALSRPNSISFLWSKPYNAIPDTMVLPQNMIRTSDWEQVIQHVRTINAK
jgi:5'(3')-deoxyribonucleotidase